ncbi:rRNA maturation RNase YbeY [candidate division Kazan bacterium]|uniref:Endoribonuclease YbeY n=1 Tax=candidate division Kazan bacterium TaxID=2202143 RepID=A0A420ZBK0_UNCK3|nr:MAG: rRNA maturation RNase YbeY [candidate division Kazan bacterium]
MGRVYIGFDDYAIDGVDDELIHSVFDVVVGVAKLSSHAEVGLVLVTDDRIRQLNKQYRNKDSVTNVLSFSCREIAQDDFLSDENKNYLGDIFICRAEVERQAREFGIAENQEFVRLFVHGLLHLAGIHHSTEAAAAEMEKLEDEIIAQIIF